MSEISKNADAASSAKIATTAKSSDAAPDQIDNINLKALLGPTLLSLTEKLGIDVRQELRSSPKVQSDLTQMLQSSNEEIDAVLSQLNVDQEKFMEQLRLDQNQTMSFFSDQTLPASATGAETPPDDMTIDQVLAKQASLQNDLLNARDMVQKSTRKMQDLLDSLNDNGDLWTYFVMFSVKPWQQQLAFNFGLTFLMKVVYDAFGSLWFPNAGWAPKPLSTLSISEDITLVLQVAVSVAAWQYAGLLRAIRNTAVSKSDPAARR